MTISPKSFLGQKSEKVSDTCSQFESGTAKLMSDTPLYECMSRRYIQRNFRDVWSRVKSGVVVECDGVYLSSSPPREERMDDRVASSLQEMSKCLNLLSEKADVVGIQDEWGA